MNDNLNNIINIWQNKKDNAEMDIYEIMSKPVSNRTWEEVKALQKAGITAKTYDLQKKLNDEVKKSYDYVYGTPENPVQHKLPLTATKTSSQKAASVGLLLKTISTIKNYKDCVKDLQKALNIMYGYSNEPLKEDGDLGEITKAAFAKALQNKSPEELKKYIKIAVINNAIINNRDQFADLDYKINQTIKEM